VPQSSQVKNRKFIGHMSAKRNQLSKCVATEDSTSQHVAYFTLKWVLIFYIFIFLIKCQTYFYFKVFSRTQLAI